MSERIVEATAETFRELVSEGQVLVDIWGPQCQPCIALMPHVERMAEARPHLRVVKLDATKARRLCMELRVMGLPAFLLLRDGEEIGRLSEPNPSPAALEQWIDSNLEMAGEGVS